MASQPIEMQSTFPPFKVSLSSRTRGTMLNRCFLSSIEGCCRIEFDSSYLNRLNGIISQNDFAESMTNINQFNTLKKAVHYLCRTVCNIFSSARWDCLWVAALHRAHRGYRFLVFIGFGVLFLAMMATTVSCCFLQRKWFKQLQQAIANESVKYSNRSQMPCRWRLNTTRPISGFHDKRNMYSAYYVSSLDVTEQN